MEDGLGGKDNRQHVKNRTILWESGMTGSCVMIGDIKESRTLDDWPNVFGKLDSTLKEVNGEFANDILVDFGPTVGDEFQGGLVDPRKAYSIYVSIKARLPVGIYCGIGIGEIEKPLKRDVGMRGTAFYRARSALDLCKERRRNLVVKSSDTANRVDRTVNALLNFIGVLENSWTSRQRQVAGYYRLHPDYTYEQLGKYFGISRQAVSQILKAADWDVISEGEAVVNELLESMYLQPEEIKAKRS